MQYDPIKRSLGAVFNQSPFLRKMFYRMLDLLLLRTWHIKKEIRQWSKQTGDDVHILDAGSGFGQYDYYLSRLNPNWKITGVDVKPEQIADCNRFFKQNGDAERIHFEEADLTTFRREETYDMVLSVDVMEHIEEDVEVFKNFYASLRNGGMVLISTPSDQGGSDVHDEEDSSFIDEHVRDGYNIREIQDKLRKAGFQVVEARYSYGKPGQKSWKLSMKYPITMLNMSKLFFLLLPFYYLFTFPVALIFNRMDVRQSHQSGTGLIVKAHKQEH